MPSLTALPQYQTAVAWSEFIPGVFTVGYSKLGDDALVADGSFESGGLTNWAATSNIIVDKGQGLGWASHPSTGIGYRCYSQGTLAANILSRHFIPVDITLPYVLSHYVEQWMGALDPNGTIRLLCYDENYNSLGFVYPNQSAAGVSYDNGHAISYTGSFVRWGGRYSGSAGVTGTATGGFIAGTRYVKVEVYLQYTPTSFASAVGVIIDGIQVVQGTVPTPLLDSMVYEGIGMGHDTLGIPYPQFPFNLPYDDISEDMLSLSYDRGRSDDLTEVQATSGTIEIVDDAEVYNPHNVSSPIQGQLNPLRPYRVRAVGPRLVPLTTNGWQIDDVVRARAVLGDGFEHALLRKKPLAYWRFDEPVAGTLAYQDAGGDSDVLAYPEGVAPQDVPSLMAGDPGLSKWLLNGSRLAVRHGDSVNPRGGMTLVVMFSLLYVPPPFPDRYFLDKPNQWSLRVDTAARLSFSYYGTDGVQVDVRTVVQLVNGTPTLAVVVWDGKTVRMWLNGAEVLVERGLRGG